MSETGVAVENWADQTVFFRCILRGVNRTLYGNRGKQFYRSCNFYGRSYIVSGGSSCFFQNCNLFTETHFNETSVLVGHSGPSLPLRIGFIFHQCRFEATGSSSNSSQVFLGSALDDDASIVVMQSHVDAIISGYFLSTTSSKSSYFATFDNSGRAPTTPSVSPLVHVLSRFVAQSRFSLRRYLAEINWVPPEVDYDLDLAT